MLRLDADDQLVLKFLIEAARRSVYFAYLLICQLSSEGTPPAEALDPPVSIIC